MRKLSWAQALSITRVLLWRTEPNLREAVPWIPWPVIDWFEKNLTPEMIIFEWGSGGSTLYIARRVKKVISIEHEAVWLVLTRIYAKLHRVSNITFFFERFETLG